jgi:hypothetical protein
MQLAKDVLAIVQAVLKVMRTIVHYVELGVAYLGKALDKAIAFEFKKSEPVEQSSTPQ